MGRNGCGSQSMKKKKRERERSYQKLLIFLAAILILVAFFANVSYQDQQRCEALQSFHPVRLIVHNHYDRTIWIIVEYSDSDVQQTDGWAVDGNSDKIIYTKHTFAKDSHVTVTFRPSDPNTLQYLPNNPAVSVLISPDLPVVYDENYQKDLKQRDATIDLQCLTDHVYEGPTITLWPTP